MYLSPPQRGRGRAAFYEKATLLVAPPLGQNGPVSVPSRSSRADFIRLDNHERYHDGSETLSRRMCAMAGATQFSDDGRPDNTGRRPSGFATIGPPGGRVLGARCPAKFGVWSRAIARRPRRSEGAQ